MANDTFLTGRALELLTYIDRFTRRIALLQRQKDAVWHRLASTRATRWNHLVEIDRLTAELAQLQAEKDGAWRFLVMFAASNSEAHEALNLLERSQAFTPDRDSLERNKQSKAKRRARRRAAKWLSPSRNNA